MRNSAKTLGSHELEFAFVPRAENSRVVPADFFGGSAVTEIVQRQRLASSVFRTLQGIRMAVVGEVCGTENHHSIENGQYPSLAARHVTVPQL